MEDTDTPEEKQDAIPAAENPAPLPGSKTLPPTSDVVVKKEGTRRKKDLEVRVSELEDENGTLRTTVAELQNFIKPKSPSPQPSSDLDDFLFT